VRLLLARLGVLLLIASGGVCAAAGPAAAHTRVVFSSPADGAVVSAVPDVVVLRFDEPVDPALSSLQLLRSGVRVALDVARRAPARELRAALPPLGPGSHRVAWRVPGVDGHAATGEIAFRVEPPSAGPAVSSSTATSPDTAAGDPSAAQSRLSSAAYGVARWTAYVGLALLLGGAFFASACIPRGSAGSRQLALGSALVVLGSLGALLTYGPSVAGLGLGHVSDTELLDATLRSDVGAAVLVRLGILGATAVALVTVARRPGPLLVLGWGALLAATWSLTGHSRTSATSSVLDVVHLVAAAVWLGGLVALLLLLRRGEDRLLSREAAARFSQVAGASVAVLLLTGTGQAVVRLGSVSAVTELVYGKLLLIKLALVLTTLAVAGLVRRRVHGAPTTHTLRRGIGVEACLGATLLGVTSALVVSSPVAPARHASEPSVVPAAAARPQGPTPPPAAAQQADDWVTTSVSYDTGTARGAVDVAVLPRVGPTSLHVTVRDHEGLPARALLSAALRPKATGIPAAVALSALGTGHYVSRGAELDRTGSWQLGLALVLEDGSRTVLSTSFTVR